MVRATGLLIAALFASAFTRAAAFELSPIVVQLEPRGPGSARNLVVNNTQSDPIALLIEVYARSADDHGQELRTPDYDSFVITPPQLVVEPSTSQAIRVQWIGSPDIEREQAFRIIVRQLPIRFVSENRDNEFQADVAVAYRYEAAVYVAPSQSDPLAELISSEAVTDDVGRRMLRLTIASKGRRRAILDQPSLQITSATGNSVDLSGERVGALQMKNILSGTQAVVDVPWPDEIEFGPVSVTLSTRYFVG